MGDPGLFQGRNCGQEEGAARELQRGPAQLNGPNMEKSILVIALLPLRLTTTTAEHSASGWT